MKYNAAWSLGLASIALCKPVIGGPVLAGRQESSSPARVGSNQQIAIASYIPTWNQAAWNTLLGYDSSKLSVIVANALNGPDSTVDATWKSIIDRGHASGKTVLGYVRTGWLGYPLNGIKRKETRTGSSVLADWVAQIERDVDAWYALYGASIGGIFFDEAYNICDNNHAEEVMAYLDRYVKIKHPGAFTVSNAGAPMGHCFENTTDTLITYEQTYENYVKTDWQGNGWTPQDIRKIWHIVYRVPESEIEKVAALALSRGAGLLHLTDDDYPNPYDVLPSDSYMQKQLASVDGGSPLTQTKTWEDGAAAATPSGLTAGAVDEDSVQLSWSAAANALGYQIYQDGKPVASVLKSMTTVQIGGLNPATSYSFAVTAVGGKGVESSQSPSISVQTKGLVDGKSIVNLSSSKSGDMLVLKADALLGYGKFKLFLWDKLDCDLSTEAAWTITVPGGHYICARFLFEADAFYYYSGPPAPGGSPGYTWTLIKAYDYDEQPVISGITRTWSFPLEAINAHYPEATKLAVEGSGYYPAATVAQS